MKKLFLSLVAAIVAAIATFAQSSLVATLSHEGGVQIFHGQTAYSQAMEAAGHGDIITLSSGRFNATNIKKGVTVRGAGFEADSVQRTFPTIISGDFTISLEESVTSSLTIEGIYHAGTIYVEKYLKEATFLKSSFSKIRFGNTIVSDLQIIHCQINQSVLFSNNSTANIINSYVTQPTNGGSNSNLEFTNCVITGSSYIPNNSYIYDLYNSVFNNCIIYSNGSEYPYCMILSPTNNVYYCIGYQGESAYETSNIFQNMTNSSNIVVPNITSIFKNGTFYELTEDAKSKYLGADGTEVGIYGGDLPYSPTVLSPQITKCQVAKKTTADGKLSVDIEVKAAE